MLGITVHQYSDPATREVWKGWIEPDDKSWILFVASDGSPVLFTDRDPVTGAIWLPS